MYRFVTPIALTIQEQPRSRRKASTSSREASNRKQETPSGLSASEGSRAVAETSRLGLRFSTSVTMLPSIPLPPSTRTFAGSGAAISEPAQAHAVQPGADQGPRVAPELVPEAEFRLLANHRAGGRAGHPHRFPARQDHLERDLRADREAATGDAQRLDERPVDRAKTIGAVRDVEAEQDPDRPPVDPLIGSEAPGNIALSLGI